MNDNKISIGYWKKSIDSNESLPWPEEGNLSSDQKNKVIQFLSEGKVKHSWRGMSQCRICGCFNGSTCLENGDFLYPSGYVHYIQDHNIQPDPRLMDFLFGDS